MSEVIIKCSVNGVVRQGMHNGKPVNAMCGLIKCSANECSLDYGKCELQYEKQLAGTTVEVLDKLEK